MTAAGRNRANIRGQGELVDAVDDSAVVPGGGSALFARLRVGAPFEAASRRVDLPCLPTAPERVEDERDDLVVCWRCAVPALDDETFASPAEFEAGGGGTTAGITGAEDASEAGAGATVGTSAVTGGDAAGAAAAGGSSGGGAACVATSRPSPVAVGSTTVEEAAGGGEDTDSACGGAAGASTAVDAGVRAIMRNAASTLSLIASMPSWTRTGSRTAT